MGSYAQMVCDDEIAVYGRDNALSGALRPPIRTKVPGT